MRSATLLLLLLALPGLLLPAGAWLHVCGCAAPMAATPSACCAPADAAPEAAERTCCSAHGQPQRAPRAADDDCRCEWIPLPDLGDEPSTPPTAPNAHALLIIASSPRIAVAPDFVPPAHRRWSPRLQRPPPPPFACRNLPLRI